MNDIRVRLSVLWVFVTLNYLYADVIALLDTVGSNSAGHASGPRMPQVFWLGIAILVEIPIAMIVLSLVLRRTANRWANIVAGAIETAAVVLATIFYPTINNGTPTPLYYLFFGTIEVAGTVLIVWYAWRWPRETVHPG